MPGGDAKECTMTSIGLNDRARSVVEDYDAIRDVVQMCLDGEATGDSEARPGPCRKPPAALYVGTEGVSLRGVVSRVRS